MAVGGKKQEHGEHGQKLTDRRASLSARGVGHRRKAQAHRIADRLSRHERGSETDLNDKAESESGDDFGYNHEKSGYGHNPCRGQRHIDRRR